MERFALTILKSLTHDEEYARKVIPFVEEEYFEEVSDRVVYQEIKNFLEHYDKLPNKEVLHVELESRSIIEGCYT